MLVKCIDIENVELHLDYIYKAEPNPKHSDHYLINISGTIAGYMKSRFVAVPSFKVRAILSTSSGLVEDQLYEVAEYPGDSRCWLIDPYIVGHNGHYKSRFSDPIDDRVPMGSRPLHVADMIEERLRKILTTRAYSNECPCGTNRTVCTFHKGL